MAPKTSNGPMTAQSPGLCRPAGHHPRSRDFAGREHLGEEVALMSNGSGTNSNIIELRRVLRHDAALPASSTAMSTAPTPAA